MGKSLIIKGADFSANKIQSVISTSQSDAGGFYSESTGNLVTTIPEIKGVAKISCVGARAIYFQPSADNSLQPPAVVCWDANDVFLGAVIGDTTGALPCGSYIFNLPSNTAKISFVYSNTYGQQNWNVGLAQVVCQI